MCVCCAILLSICMRVKYARRSEIERAKREDWRLCRYLNGMSHVVLTPSNIALKVVRSHSLSHIVISICLELSNEDIYVVELSPSLDIECTDFTSTYWLVWMTRKQIAMEMEMETSMKYFWFCVDNLFTKKNSHI